MKIAPAILAVLVALLALPAVAAAQGGPDVDDPPLVSNGVLSPNTLPAEGGQVTISAEVVDDLGLTTVYADVVGTDGSSQSVDLLPAGGTIYSGVFAAPPNHGDAPVSYSVSVWATDTNGQVGAAAMGEIQVDAPPPFDEAPNAFDPLVSPRSLPATGGTVTISASATDNRGISEVHATVLLPGGGGADMILEPISSSRFEGTFTAPPNRARTPASYAVSITAYDDIGQPGTVDGGTFTVAGRRVTKPPCRKASGRHGRKQWHHPRRCR